MACVDSCIDSNRSGFLTSDAQHSSASFFSGQQQLHTKQKLQKGMILGDVLTCACVSVCSLFPDDMWSQRAVIKWPESGASSQSVSSALLLSHCQTGSKCRGLGTEGQQH